MKIVPGTPLVHRLPDSEHIKSKHAESEFYVIITYCAVKKHSIAKQTEHLICKINAASQRINLYL